MMIDQRLSTGDPFLDAMADSRDKAAAPRLLAEAGRDQNLFKWCPVHQYSRLRTDPVCSGCIGPHTGHSECAPPRY